MIGRALNENPVSLCYMWVLYFVANMFQKLIVCVHALHLVVDEGTIPATGNWQIKFGLLSLEHLSREKLDEQVSHSYNFFY